jgi:threonine dehydratase
MTEIKFDDIEKAAVRIAPYARRTPVLTSASLDDAAGARLFLKCENMQRVGAFKFRGACNAVFSLDDAEAAKGVATHSSGNHAQALALAARLRGVPAYIAMPRNAPAVKRAGVEGYGGIITFCEPTVESRESTLARIIAQTGAEVVHPYNDRRVIAGQGTAALELLAEVADLDVVVAPVGGGGLLSGTALAAHGAGKRIRVIGAEPKQADDAYRSIEAGRILPSVNPQTIADGLRTSLGELTFAVISREVEQIVTVSEEAIVAAMRLVWERVKIIVEPSGAVPVAALLEGGFRAPGKRIGVIVSGGNVDLDALPW